jgi:phosphoribosylformimino-5-aminoimidazole carboxamide ribonucleotide (ProFAR) isomerase
VLVRAQISITSDRLLFGDGNVLTLAEALVAKGARALQLRDIDGDIPKGDLPVWLEQLFATLGGDVPVQLDSAVHDSSAIERLAAVPFDGIVVGMKALFEPMLLRWALDLLGPRLVAELNVDGDHLFDPPPHGFSLELGEAVRQLHFQGVRHVLFRDITGLELPLNRLQTVCGTLGMGVTYAGPVRSLDDIRELTMIDPVHLLGVVVGEPLYDGRVDIGRATRLVS